MTRDKNEGTLPAADQSILQEIARASEQYDEYLSLTKLGAFSASLVSESTWGHDPNAPLSIELTQKA